MENLGEMLLLMIFLFSTIAGTGIAIVRLLVSWCACGEDDENTDLDGHDEVVDSNGSLGNCLVSPTEMEGHAGGYHANGNHRPDDSKNPVGNGVLNANECLVPGGQSQPQNQEKREKEAVSKPLSDDRGVPDDSDEPAADTGHHVSAASRMETPVYRTFPASKFTTSGLSVPFSTSSRSMLQGLPANPRTDQGKDAQRGETTDSHTPEKPKPKHFHSSQRGISNIPGLSSTKRPPAKTSESSHEQKRGDGDATAPLVTIHKVYGTGGFEIQVPAAGTDRNSPQATPPTQKTFTRISNDELAAKNVLPSTFGCRVAKNPLVNVVGKPKDKKSNLKSANIPKPLEFAPSSFLRSPRQFGATLAPEIVVAAPENQKTDKKGKQCDASNQIPFDLVNSHLNPRQNSARASSLARERADPANTEKLSSSSSEKLPRKGRPLPASKFLEFTPGIFGSSRSLGGASNTQVGASNQIPGLAEPNESLSFSRTRQISMLRPRKTTPPETKSLKFTADRNFHNPSHFPQTPPVFQKVPGNQSKSTKIFAEESVGILDGDKRILQDGSLKKPLVGRVKLVSKLDGTDPGFTYATWAKAGSKRSRGAHHCQEEGGCRVCD